MDKIITVSPTETINMPNVNKALGELLYSGFNFKMITNGYYIQFNFSRSGEITCSSNIMNPLFIRERNYNESLGWNVSRCSSFLYQWMQICRNTIY